MEAICSITNEPYWQKEIVSSIITFIIKYNVKEIQFIVKQHCEYQLIDVFDKYIEEEGIEMSNFSLKNIQEKLDFDKFETLEKKQLLSNASFTIVCNLGPEENIKNDQIDFDGEIIKIGEEIYLKFSPELNGYDKVMMQNLKEWIKLQILHPTDPISQLNIGNTSLVIKGKSVNINTNDKSIFQLFQAICKENPNHIGLIGEYNNQIREMTYNDLEKEVNRLSNYLESKYDWKKWRDEGQTINIGVYMDRCIELIVVIFTILKLGGTYVPLDQSNPTERLKYIIENANPKLIIANTHYTVLPEQVKIEQININDVNKLLDNVISYQNKENVNLEVKESLDFSNSNKTAYILYTSGSTGKPKGVCGTQKGIINRLKWMEMEYPFGENERIINKTSIGFVDSIWEIFGSILGKIQLIVVSNSISKDTNQLLEAIQHWKITRFVTVPSFINHLLKLHQIENEENNQVRIIHKMKGLKYIIISGEALEMKLVEELSVKIEENQINQGKCKIINLYGSTEVAGDVSFYLFHKETTENQQNYIKSSKILNKRINYCSIGEILWNNEGYILDNEYNHVPEGIIGNLYISGDCLSTGYFNELNTSRNAFGNVNKYNKILYNTNDRVFYLNSKNYSNLEENLEKNQNRIELFYYGRKDFQVKIKGHRIELEEIEMTFKSIPFIKKTILIVHKFENQSHYQLFAFILLHEMVTLTNNEEKMKINLIYEEIMNKLPFYMIPSQIKIISCIPLTYNGKIDRTKLLKKLNKSKKNKNQENSEKEMNEMEKRISELFKEVLELDKEEVMLNKEDKFTILGGDSLLAIQLINKIYFHFHYLFSVSNIFKLQSIQNIAAFLANSVEENKNFQNVNNQEISGNFDDFIRKKIMKNEKKLENEGEHGVELSYSQKGLFLLEELFPSSSAFIISFSVHLRGFLNISIFRKSIEYLINYQKSLKMNLIGVSLGNPKIRINSQLNNEDIISIKDYTENLIHLPKNQIKNRVIQKITKQSMKSMKIKNEKKSLFKIYLFYFENKKNKIFVENEENQLKKGEFYFLFKIHHLISDGWSIGHFIIQLNKIYNYFLNTPNQSIKQDEGNLEKAIGIPTGQVGYLEYLQWENQLLHSLPSFPFLQQQFNFWKDHLKNYKKATNQLSRQDWTPFRPSQEGEETHSPSNYNKKAKNIVKILSKESTEKIQAFVKEENSTEFIFYFMILSLVVHKYKNSNDLLFVTPTAMRNYDSVKHLVGMFVNTFLLRVQFDFHRPESSIRDLFRYLHDLFFLSLENSTIPLEYLIHHLHSPLSSDPVASHFPHFMANDNSLEDMFFTQMMIVQEEPLPSSLFSLSNIYSSEDVLLLDSSTPLDFVLFVRHLPDHSTQLRFKFSTLAFPDEIMNQIADFYVHFMDTILQQATYPLHASPLSMQTRLDMKIKEIEGKQGIIPDEFDKILNVWNQTDAPYPSENSIYEIIMKHALERPQSIAVRHGNQQITYEEFVNKCKKIGSFIQKGKNFQEGNVVGIYSERNIDSIVLMISIIFSGCLYAPLDPELPPSRLLNLIKQSKCQLILTTAENATNMLSNDLFKLIQEERKQKEAGDGEDEEWLVDIVIHDAHSIIHSNKYHASEFHDDFYTLRNPSWRLRNGIAHEDHREENKEGKRVEYNAAEHGCYVLFTSGTTGKPKGVICTHENVIGLVHSMNWMKVNETDTVTQLNTHNFDLSVCEIFTGLLHGCKLIIIDKSTLLDPTEIEKMINKEKITVMIIPTSIFNIISLYNPSAFHHIHYLVFGGEKANDKLCKKVIESGKPPRNLVNIYGPTEITYACTFYYVNCQNVHSPIPIGKCMSNSTVYILDEELNLLPIGFPGEIVVGGAKVALGYINNPSLTNEKFIPDHIFPLSSLSTMEGHSSSSNHRRLYRTGDVGRYLFNGNIEFIGRQDFQVKIRGFRVEPEEITNVILSIHHVYNAVVIVKAKSQLFLTSSGNTCTPVDLLSSNALENEEKVLIAYYQGDCEANYIASEIKKKLPDYMIPTFIEKLQALPLNPRGKVDRAQLPLPVPIQQQKLSGSHEAAPGTLELPLEAIPLSEKDTEMDKYEKIIGKLFEDLLNYQVKSREDKFLEKGGNSLLAMRLLGILNTKFNVHISIRDFFPDSSIRNLAKHLATSSVFHAPSNAHPGPLSLQEMVEKRESKEETRGIKENERYELSLGQRRLWIEQKLSENSGHFNVPFNISIHNENQFLSTEKLLKLLEKTLIHLFSYHKIFFTVFNDPSRYHQEPTQQYFPDFFLFNPSQFTLPFQTIQQQEKHNALLQHHLLPFYLNKQTSKKENPYLFRYKLFIIQQNDTENDPRSLPGGARDRERMEFIVAVTFHHLLCDGWSLSIFYEDFLSIFKYYKKNKLLKLFKKYPIPRNIFYLFGEEPRVSFQDENHKQQFLHELKFDFFDAKYFRRIEYLHYAQYDRNLLEKQIESDFHYWKGQIENLGKFKLPFHLHQKENKQEYKMNELKKNYLSSEAIEHSISSDKYQKIKEIANKHGVTVYALLLCVFKILLFRYTENNDFSIGSIVSNRYLHPTLLTNFPNESLDDVIGFFINNILVRSHPEFHKCFKEYLEEVKENILNSIVHKVTDYSKIKELMESTGQGGNTDIHKYFHIVFILQDTLSHPRRVSKLLFQHEFQDLPINKFDLVLEIIPRPVSSSVEEEAVSILSFNTEIYEYKYMKELVENYHVLLDDILSSYDDHSLSSKLIKQFTILSEDRKEILKERGRKVQEYRRKNEGKDRNKTLYYYFREVTEKYADSMAVKSINYELTFSGLKERVNLLAGYFLDKGIKEGEIVALLLSNDIHRIICMLALVSIGAIYLPLEFSIPCRNMEFIFDSLIIQYLLIDDITKDEFQSKYIKLNKSNQQIHFISVLFDGQFLEQEEELENEEKRREKMEKNEKRILEIQNRFTTKIGCYVLFTSGSTGQPKGVLVTQENVIFRFFKTNKKLRLRESLVTLHTSSLLFDPSIAEFFSIFNGAAVVFIPVQLINVDEVVNIIEKYGVNSLMIPTAYLHILIQHKPEVFQFIRRLVFGGEVVSSALINKLLHEYKFNHDLINLYGPTETTYSVTYHFITPTTHTGAIRKYEGTVPIGRMIKHGYYYILDSEMNLLPSGCRGELYIGGYLVSNGYINNPTKTQASFLPDPFLELLDQGERRMVMYKTGDRVYEDHNGEIIYLGRTDTQIKLMGYRIELEEIQNIVLSNNHVHSAVVTVSTQSNPSFSSNLAELIVYYSGSIYSDDLRRYLSNNLPHYMIPTKYFKLDHLKITPTGKLDKKYLESLSSNQLSTPIPSIEALPSSSAPLPIIKRSLLSHSSSFSSATDTSGPSTPSSFPSSPSSHSFTDEFDEYYEEEDHGKEISGFHSFENVNNAVKKLWEDILEYSMHDEEKTFFESGGTSLKLINLFKLINEYFNTSITIADLLIHTSILSQSNFLFSILSKNNTNPSIPTTTFHPPSKTIHQSSQKPTLSQKQEGKDNKKVKFNTNQEVKKEKEGKDEEEEEEEKEEEEKEGKVEKEKDEIAVIGFDCIFPKSKTPLEFWNNLKEGKDCITRDEENENENLRLSMAREVTANGVVDEVEQFDYVYFELNKSESSNIDPQHRLLLEVVSNSLHMASIDPLTYQSSIESSYKTDKIKKKIGIFTGLLSSTYHKHKNNQENEENIHKDENCTAEKFQEEIASLLDSAATRVAYKLGFKGPAMAIQTACSSSLVAIHVACQSILQNDCTVAIASGASINFPQDESYIYQPGMILSPEGKCRPFDIQANGIVSGNGIGAVVLMSLKEAVRYKYPIFAVIKATATNNDGNEKASYNSANINQHVELIKDAIHKGNVCANEIDYIEAHGAGTVLGDLIECAAFSKVYNRPKASSKSSRKMNKTSVVQEISDKVILGSVKSNIGHLGPAAGIAGLIKVLLSLHFQSIPKTIHFTEFHPHINSLNHSFSIPSTNFPWKTTSHKARTAAVHSFGQGGSNAHVILQEYPPPSSSHRQRTSNSHASLPSSLYPFHLFPFSAKSKSALLVWIKNHLRFFIEQGEKKEKIQVASNITAEAVSYTLQFGRKEFPHRKAFIADSLHSLTMQFIEYIKSSEASSSRSADSTIIKCNKQMNKTKVGFLFPGQGTQYIGMSEELYKYYPKYRKIMNQCFQIIQSNFQIDLKSILYASSSSPSSKIDLNKLMKQTEYTQLIIFTINYSIGRLLMKLGVHPTVMIGHSVGELSAACLSGVIHLSDAIRLIYHRSQLMASLPPGKMIVCKVEKPIHPSISFSSSLFFHSLSSNTLPASHTSPRDSKYTSLDELYSIANQFEVDIAAINSSNQVVYSGEKESIMKLKEHLERNEMKVLELETSHAFHSSMMNDIIQEFKNKISTIPLHKPKIPFISSVSGELIKESEAISHEYWANQIRAPVLFYFGLVQFINYLRTGRGRSESTDPCTSEDLLQIILIQCGPSETLLNISKSYCHKEMQLNNVLFPTSIIKKNKSESENLLDTVRTAWELGIPIDWKIISAKIQPRIILPNYPYEKVLCSRLNYSSPSDITPRHPPFPSPSPSISLSPSPSPSNPPPSLFAQPLLQINDHEEMGESLFHNMPAHPSRISSLPGGTKEGGNCLHISGITERDYVELKNEMNELKMKLESKNELLIKSLIQNQEILTSHFHLQSQLQYHQLQLHSFLLSQYQHQQYYLQPFLHPFHPSPTPIPTPTPTPSPPSPFPFQQYPNYQPNTWFPYPNPSSFPTGNQYPFPSGAGFPPSFVPPGSMGMGMGMGTGMGMSHLPTASRIVAESGRKQEIKKQMKKLMGGLVSKVDHENMKIKVAILHKDNKKEYFQFDKRGGRKEEEEKVVKEVEEEEEKEERGGKKIALACISSIFTLTLFEIFLRKGIIQSRSSYLEDYLPNSFIKVPKYDNKEENRIQLHHVASHTSGLPCLPSNIRWDSNDHSPLSITNYSLKQLQQYFKDNHQENQITKHKAGEYCSYSVLGMSLLSLALLYAKNKSNLSGNIMENYQNLLNEEIFHPLGIRNITLFPLLPTSPSLSLPDDHQVEIGYSTQGRKQPVWSCGDVFALVDGFHATMSDLLDFIDFQECQSRLPSIRHYLLYTKQKNMFWNVGLTDSTSSWVAFDPTNRKIVCVFVNTALDISFELTKFAEKLISWLNYYSISDVFALQDHAIIEKILSSPTEFITDDIYNLWIGHFTHPSLLDHITYPLSPFPLPSTFPVPATSLPSPSFPHQSISLHTPFTNDAAGTRLGQERNPSSKITSQSHPNPPLQSQSLPHHKAGGGGGGGGGEPSRMGEYRGSQSVSSLEEECIGEFNAEKLRTIIEKSINQIIGEEENNKVSISNTFEDNGIDSLKILILAADLKKKLKRSLPITLFHDYPTIQSLINYLLSSPIPKQASYIPLTSDSCPIMPVQPIQITSSSSTPSKPTTPATNNGGNHMHLLPIKLERRVLSNSLFKSFIFNEKKLPLVLTPAKRLEDIHSFFNELEKYSPEIERLISHYGGVLFRGFPLETADHFNEVVNRLYSNETTLNYQDGISPRTSIIADSVFTSTEYPAEYDMALHNEMSYSPFPPNRIFFFCHTEPGVQCGGETPIADSHEIYNQINEEIRREFEGKKLKYVTNLPSDVGGHKLGLSWQKTYQTDSPKQVEHFCQLNNIHFEWVDPVTGEAIECGCRQYNENKITLRTVRIASAVKILEDKRKVWYNHAHLFHPSDLPERTRSSMKELIPEHLFPKNCYFEDGSNIPEDYLANIRAAMKRCEIVFPWKKGDVIILNNNRVCHGRRSFKGPRKILVSMK